MAKRRVRKSKQAKPDAAGVKSETGTSGPAETPAAGSVPEAKPRADGKARKQLRRLERQLADAARAEAKRVRRLEKARWRRQRLEATLDAVKTSSSPVPGKAAKAPKPGTNPATKPAPEPRSNGKAAAGRAAAKAAADPKVAAPTTEAKAKATARSRAPRAEAAPASSVEQPIEAYCLREKKRVQMVEPKPVVTANGGAALSGTCPSCGAALYKLVSRTAR